MKIPVWLAVNWRKLKYFPNPEVNHLKYFIGSKESAETPAPKRVQDHNLIHREQADDREEKCSIMLQMRKKTIKWLYITGSIYLSGFKSQAIYNRNEGWI